MKILLTGGLGYIGSHCLTELLNSGYDVVVIDNLSNSKLDVIDKVKKITSKDIVYYNIDYRDKESLRHIFDKESIDAVINFAGFKAVGESVKDPLKYYDNNVYGAICLLEVMKEYNVKKFVFSSSATVYGIPKSVPIKEDASISKTSSPYGNTKLVIEYILEDLYKSDNTWSIAVLRYFNPIGAHESSLIGENPNGIPNNLMPYITKVAKGQLKELSIFGNDYMTHDGTGVRDYIHVVDLAIGHIKALDKIINKQNGYFVYNLGTGTGYSVLDIVETFERVNKVHVPYRFAKRRPGDIDSYYADIEKSKNELGFVASKNLEDMVRDSWNYEKNN